MKNKILLPIGLSNFAQIIQHRSDDGYRYTLVDKSMLIKSFLGSNESVSVVTRPRRFGKTLNLSMLEHFFAPEVYGIKTEGLFDGLKISNHPETMRYQGQYQAVFITLKTVKGGDYKTFYAGIRKQIAELFQKHEAYVFSCGIKQDHKNLYKEIANSKAPEVEYANALRFLSQLLYQASGEKVYIFLDEYDTPIHDAYIHGYYDKCTKLMARLFNNTFKDNPYLAKGMITGILKVAKASLFSDLNNVKIYSMLKDERYASYFGFTEGETDDLLDKASLPTKAHELKEMYNGYVVNDITLYNPWSIVNFVDSATLLPEERIEEAIRPYWVNTGGTGLLVDLLRNNLLDVQENMSKLVQGGEMVSIINEEVRFSPLMRDNATAFWSVMLLSGYLKPVEIMDRYSIFPRYSLSFPNEEIRRTFQRVSIEVSAGNLGYASDLIDACQKLVMGDAVPFSTYLECYLKETTSYFDGQGEYKELFFHGLVLGIAACLTRTHHVRSNRESGKGRYDVSIMPKDTGQLGVILEIKAVESAGDMKVLAETACKQAMMREYYTEMRALGLPKVLMVGMAFDQKEVVISTDMQG